MAKINIAELDIDINALIKSTQEVKQALDSVKANQKELTKQGQTSSAQFIQNATDIKSLSQAYNANVKAIADSTNAKADEENRTKLIALALNTEVNSIKDAREQNSLLTKLRNEANVATQEGRVELFNLNKKLDENNEFIRENADAYTRLKMNIGNYSESVKEALEGINPLNGGLTGFIQRSQEAGGAGNLLKSSLAGATQGVLGMVKASLAFIATPIGAVITVIALAVTTLYNVFKSFTPVVDKVEQVVAGLSAVLSVVKNTIIGLVTGAKSLGEAFSSLGSDMNNAYKDAERLKKAQQDLEDAMKQQEVQSAKNRAEINRLNIQAKDRTKSEEERLALLQKAEKIEQADFEQRKKNSDEALRQAYEQIRIEASLTEEEFKQLKKRGIAYLEYVETKASGQEENFDRLKEALLKETEIENEFYSNQEKNINKQNKLIEDAEEKKEKARQEAIKRQEEAEARRQKILDDSLAKSQAELNLFLSQQGTKAKSLEETLAIAEKVYQKQLEINQKEFDASKKTEVDKLNLLTANNEAKNTLLQTQNDAVIANAERELQIFKDLNKSKIEQGKYVTDELLKQELDRLNKVSEEEAYVQTLRFQNGLINEQQYIDAIKQIDAEYQNGKQQAEQQRDEAQKQKKAIDLENKRLADNATFEEQLALELERLEAKRQQELSNAEKTGADIKLINDKYDSDRLRITQATENAKISLMSQTLGQLKGLLKENTVMAKALGIAEATINTYLGATKALATLPPPWGGIQAGITIASGLAQVAKIGGVQFAGGGWAEAQGASHAQGGIPIHIGGQYFGEMQGGEGLAIMNKGSFSSFKAFNQTYGDSDVKRTFTPNYFAGGGVITQGVSTQTINATDIANIMFESINNMPAPQVAVTDIHRESNSYIEVVNGANF